MNNVRISRNQQRRNLQLAEARNRQATPLIAAVKMAAERAALRGELVELDLLIGIEQARVETVEMKGERDPDYTLLDRMQDRADLLAGDLAKVTA